MNKDIENIKASGWFFLFMGLSMKALAASRRDNNIGTDRLDSISDRNDVVTGDPSTAGQISSEEL